MTAIATAAYETGRLIAGILAQRRDDGEGGWIQLLIFIVMIVFFLISNIAKSRAERQQQEQAEVEEEPMFPIRRRPVLRPKPPAQARKIFSHKQSVPAASEVAVAQPVEQFPEMQITATPEPAKPVRKILSLELAALENRDELARGIIYSEILGKPLALREKWGYE